MAPSGLYFRWLCGLVDKNGWYPSLLRYMDSIPFVSEHPMDMNRAEDGKYMRYIYKEETGIDSERDCQCTVLELFVGFAWRLSFYMGNIQEDWGGENGIIPWFWTMMRNMGIDEEKGERINLVHVKNAIDIFMYRAYDDHGRGGPFYVENPCGDMREAELWDQANWYLIQHRPLNWFE